MIRRHRRKGVFHRLALYFIPSENNSYRPKILRRSALTFVLALVLLVEAGMLAQILAHTAIRDFLAAIFPASIIAFTNEERAQSSLSTLTQNATLQAAAQKKADDMAAKGYFSHVGPDGKEPWAWFKEAGYDYRYAGENLAVNFYDSSDVVHAWMASPSHKANIVKPVYTEIGIGVADGMYQGKPTTFVVQFFGTPRALASTKSPTQAATAPSPSPQTIVSKAPPQKTALQGAPVSQVQGEAVAAQPSAAVAASKGSSFLMRVLGSPRLTASWILSLLSGLLIVGLLFTLFIRIQIQPLDLLAGGAVAAAFVIGLITLNSFVLTSGIRIGDEAASSVIEALATSSAIDAESF